MTIGRHDHDSHEQWDELAVGYALSALEPDELDRFLQHLVGFCPDCSRSVADMNVVGAELASAIPVPQPRADLKADVLAAALAARPAVAQSTADLPGSVSEAEPAAPAGPAAAAPERAGAHRVPDELAVRRTRRSSAGRTGWLVAAAAAVIAIVMTLVTVAAVNGRGDQQNVAGSRVAELVPMRTDSGQTVAAVVAHKESVVVVPYGIEANPKTSTYVLWGIESNTSAPVALGVFDVDKSGAKPVQVASDSGGYGMFSIFAISEEPGRTAPSAPSTIVAKGQT